MPIHRPPLCQVALPAGRSRGVVARVVVPGVVAFRALASRVVASRAPLPRTIRSAAFVIPIVALLSSSLLLGCAGDDGRQSDDPSTRRIQVVSTVGMITDSAEQIGGDRVNVMGLMGPGVDPHLYKASASDVAKMQKADIIFYNGLHLEGAMGELFEQMVGRKPTVAVAEGISEEKLLSDPGKRGVHDPHVWFDVSLWIDAARKIEDALVEVDPQSEQAYRARGQAYRDSLAQLQQFVEARAAELPVEQRVLITAHDAFHYFGRAYGFEVYGLQGISTVSEAGTADVQKLADFIAARHVPAIFVESSVPPRTIEALQAAVKARGFQVSIGGELFSDAMGDPDTSEGSYLGMVTHNINTIVDALKGGGSR